MNSSIVKAKEYKNDTNNRHRLTRNNDDDCDTSHPEIKATTYIPTVTGVAYDQNESNDPEEDEYIQALNSNPNPFPVPYPAPIRVVDRGVSATSGAVYTDGVSLLIVFILLLLLIYISSFIYRFKSMPLIQLVVI